MICFRKRVSGMTRKQKLRLQIDELMSQIPNLPKDFTDWIIKKSMPKSKYIFYKRRGRTKVIDGVCSHCGNRLILDKAAHNTKGKCPECKSKAIFKAINKAKYFQDSDIISIIQKMHDSMYVIRYFKVVKTYKHGEDTSGFPETILNTLTDPQFWIWEGSREIIKIQKNGKVKWQSYELLWDYEYGCEVWRKEKKRSTFFNKELLRISKTFVYKRNLKRLIKKTRWKYSGIGHYTESHFNIGDYLSTYETYPAIEMLSKMKANVLLGEIIDRYTG
jgi:DNA-directed RNA polymerase subunit RPC12/RpoP